MNTSLKTTIASWIMVVFMGSLPLSLGFAQDAAATQSSAATQQTDNQKPDLPKQAAFLNVMREIQRKQSEIDTLYGSMPIGFPKLQKEHMAKIDGTKKSIAQLQSRLRDTVLEAYMESPTHSPIIKQSLITSLARCLNPTSASQFFDPKQALEICSAMLEKESPTPAISYYAFQACFALQDFDRARTMLDQVAQLSGREMPDIVAQLEATEKNWARELELRVEEAKADDLPRVMFETTAGKFVVELFENEAPNTVNNFIYLVEKGYYDGRTFFLVKPGVFANTGCTKENGTSNPGYFIPCECNEPNARHHFTGTLSMAVKGKDKGGSMFFITAQPNQTFDGKYTAFGRIIENVDICRRFKSVDNTISKSDTEPTKITKATVLRKRAHDYKPTRLPNGQPQLPGSLLETPAETGDGGGPLNETNRG